MNEDNKTDIPTPTLTAQEQFYAEILAKKQARSEWWSNNGYLFFAVPAILLLVILVINILVAISITIPHSQAYNAVEHVVNKTLEGKSITVTNCRYIYIYTNTVQIVTP